MFFVRHGQSVFNAEASRLGRDPQTPDPALTELGIEQARRAAKQLIGQGVEMVLSSPYTRALQTASIIAQNLGVPMSVEPLAGERVLYSCDVGSQVDVLRQAWPTLDFSEMAEGQWWPAMGEGDASLMVRARAFRAKWPPQRRDIVLVSHWYFLFGLTGHDFENAEVFEV